MSQIAYTMLPGKGDPDRLFETLASRITKTGQTVVGCVQGKDASNGMSIRILPGGKELQISQNLGPGSDGCRMDQNALERAVATVEAAYTPSTDLLLINKFGKREAGGGGFRPLIGKALSDGVPVLVGLNDLNLEAFKAFAGGLDRRVDPNLAAMLAWFEKARETVGA
ncbi:MAG: DUF2478 domain-containing protein [Pseudomonadota bacterium]